MQGKGAAEGIDHSGCCRTSPGQRGGSTLMEPGPGHRQRWQLPEVTRKGRRTRRAYQRPGVPHDALLRARVAPGLQLGQADGPGERPPAPMKRTEVRRPGRRVLRGAEGWGLTEAAQPASHGPAILDATLGGDAGPWQEAAEQAVGLAVDPVRDGAGAQVR